MKKLIYTLILVVLVSCGTSKKETNNYEDFINSVENVYMKIVQKNKPFSKDTLYIDTVEIFVIKDTTDKLFGAKSFYVSGKYKTIFYDGKNIYFLNKYDSTYSKEIPDSNIARSIYLFKSLWNGIDTSNAIKSTFSRDSIVLYLPDQEDFTNRKFTLFIDKDGKPISSKYYTKWMFLHRVQENIIDKYVVNSDSVKNFLESYKIPEGYNEIKEEQNDEESNFSYELTGKKAPDFEFVYLNNNKKSRLTDLKGSNVIIDFWYIGCYWCSKLAPHLNKLYNEYKDKNVIVLGANPYDKEDKIIKYKDFNKLDYDVVKVDRNVPKNYKVPGYPFVVFIDSKGIIKGIQLGYDKDGCYDSLKTKLNKFFNIK